jgi:penicillin-binding protein 2
MSQVLDPGGTAPSAHLQGIDFAGKTGSAQTISNTAKSKMGAAGKSKFKDNGWFAGVEPRRNPEIVVGVLVEQGEHGYLAARIAAQVIKAYVEKRRRQPAKLASAPGQQVEIGGVWNTTDGDAGEDQLRAGRFFLTLPRKLPPVAAAAPGMMNALPPPGTE